MRIISRILPAVLLVSILVQGMLYSFESRIKLAGRKDFVLSADSRLIVLEIGYIHLAEKNESFLTNVGELPSPFGFSGEDPELPTVLAQESPEPEEPVAAPINYDDSAVLAAAAVSFSKKVRGSIARGQTSFLQIEGGTMLKPGTSFPVRIPQAENQSFTLTVSEISSDSYTLELGSARKEMFYDNANRSSSSSIQFSNP
ncbi:MAG: hypothetical protein AAF065_13435 [Verrucomicrobiota bacterium]